jgi:UPF0271 protein
MVRAAEDAGIRAVSEAFVDRAYRADGTLVPRGEAGAVLDDVDAMAERAVRIVLEGTVSTVDGGTLVLNAESLCTHGDGPRAVAVVRAVRDRLAAAGVSLAAFARD